MSGGLEQDLAIKFLFEHVTCCGIQGRLSLKPARGTAGEDFDVEVPGSRARRLRSIAGNSPLRGLGVERGRSFLLRKSWFRDED